MDELRRLDRAERHCFNVLSNRLRESHEKERTRGERTKYMSIVGSLFGAVVGITAGTAATRMKMKDLKKVVEDSTPKDAAMQETVTQLSNTLQAQQQQTAEFILDLKVRDHLQRPILPSRNNAHFVFVYNCFYFRQF